MKPVIGLENHIELKTKSKMFCPCSADYFGKKPNTHTCPVCLGLPGALPVPNKTAIEWCIKIALALNCQISKTSKFDRKNYFYPDLPKGYQVSQYDMPFGINGSLKLKVKNEKLKVEDAKTIRIRRAHMEEDTGKLIHDFANSNSQISSSNNKVSLIDFNRSGVPLVEIVTEPDFHTSSDVKEYLQMLQQTVRYLDVSNADMEKGEMRLEPNISLSTDVNILPNYKVEVKNINSFRFVERAIEYELKRHKELLEKRETPAQETRGWDESKGITVSQRIKEEANDYRYFPEPDIPPIIFTDEQIEGLRNQIPELPNVKAQRFVAEYDITEYDTEILTREKQSADYFEEAVKIGKEHNVSAKQIANVIINKKVDINVTLPAKLIEDIKKLSTVEEVDESEILLVIQQVLSEQEKAVNDYKSGRESVIMFLVGQVMRKLGKKVDAELVHEKLLSILK